MKTSSILMTAILIGMGISIIAYSTAYKKEHSSFEKDKAISTLNKYQKIWNEIENGNANPSSNTLLKLAKGLGKKLQVSLV